MLDLDLEGCSKDPKNFFFAVLTTGIAEAIVEEFQHIQKIPLAETAHRLGFGHMFGFGTGQATRVIFRYLFLELKGAQCPHFLPPRDGTAMTSETPTASSSPPVVTSRKSTTIFTMQLLATEAKEVTPVLPQREGRLAGAGLRDNSNPPLNGPLTPGTTAEPVALTRRPRRSTAVPASVLHDETLNTDIAVLPPNYSFELHKTVHRIRECGARRVALQMPEGLLLYATTISDILRRHTGCGDTVVLGDVTYGACCVDDLSAHALGCDFLVHYGHSCLVPVTQCLLPMLYVFVHIAFDSSHLLATIRENFQAGVKLALLATIQFVDTLQKVRDELMQEFKDAYIPQARPLSPGELLGCTAPVLPKETEVLVYVGDGRFHLESVMIANPNVKAYRYDPYSKRLTEEKYGHGEMRAMRFEAVMEAAQVRNFAVVLGTLGRQGSVKILERVLKAIRENGKRVVVVLLSEITPAKIRRMEESGIEAWVQIACPRLSIDWGSGYGRRPLLNPYEAFVAFGKTEWRERYPMDYYAKGGGEWTNYYKEERKKEGKRATNITV